MPVEEILGNSLNPSSTPQPLDPLIATSSIRLQKSGRHRDGTALKAPGV
jgi:hypothetical protein